MSFLVMQGVEFCAITSQRIFDSTLIVLSFSQLLEDLQGWYVLVNGMVHASDDTWRTCHTWRALKIVWCILQIKRDHVCPLTHIV